MIHCVIFNFLLHVCSFWLIFSTSREFTFFSKKTRILWFPPTLIFKKTKEPMIQRGPSPVFDARFPVSIINSSQSSTYFHWIMAGQPGLLVRLPSEISLLVVSTQLKNMSQNGNLPQIGVKIKNNWNHHLDPYFTASEICPPIEPTVDLITAQMVISLAKSISYTEWTMVYLPIPLNNEPPGYPFQHHWKNPRTAWTVES